MVSLEGYLPSKEKWRESASGFAFCEPGRYVIMKQNLPRNKAQRAFREFRQRAVRR